MRFAARNIVPTYSATKTTYNLGLNISYLYTLYLEQHIKTIYIEGLLFMDFDNVKLTSQNQCLNNNKFDCSETMDCNIPQ